MIDRQNIKDAIEDLQQAVTDGMTFEQALEEISSEYEIPSPTLVKNIQRVGTLEQFEASCLIARASRKTSEETFSPLREHLFKIFSKIPEPIGAEVGTILFIQKNFDRDLWSKANAYARRQVKTLRLTRTFNEEKSDAQNR